MRLYGPLAPGGAVGVPARPEAAVPGGGGAVSRVCARAGDVWQRLSLLPQGVGCVAAPPRLRRGRRRCSPSEPGRGSEPAAVCVADCIDIACEYPNLEGWVENVCRASSVRRREDCEGISLNMYLCQRRVLDCFH